MKPSLRQVATVAFGILCLSVRKGHAAETAIPYPTGAYLQRERKFYAAAEGLPGDYIQAVAVTRDGSVIAAVSNYVAQLNGDGTHWSVVARPTGVSALFAPHEGPVVLAGATNGVWALGDGSWSLEEQSPEN